MEGKRKFFVTVITVVCATIFMIVCLFRIPAEITKFAEWYLLGVLGASLGYGAANSYEHKVKAQSGDK